jgi:hypothetical protein
MSSGLVGAGEGYSRKSFKRNYLASKSSPKNPWTGTIDESAVLAVRTQIRVKSAEFVIEHLLAPAVHRPEADCLKIRSDRKNP